MRINLLADVRLRTFIPYDDVPILEPILRAAGVPVSRRIDRARTGYFCKRCNREDDTNSADTCWFCVRDEAIETPHQGARSMSMEERCTRMLTRSFGPRFFVNLGALLASLRAPVRFHRPDRPAGPDARSQRAPRATQPVERLWAPSDIARVLGHLWRRPDEVSGFLDLRAVVRAAGQDPGWEVVADNDGMPLPVFVGMDLAAQQTPRLNQYECADIAQATLLLRRLNALETIAS